MEPSFGEIAHSNVAADIGVARSTLPERIAGCRTGHTWLTDVGLDTERGIAKTREYRLNCVYQCGSQPRILCPRAPPDAETSLQRQKSRASHAQRGGTGSADAVDFL